MTVGSGAADPATRIVEATWALVVDNPSRDPSVRAIAAKAEVNLAMVSYYYQGKEGLLRGMFHTYAKPLQQTRVEHLLQLRGADLTLENVVAAWLAPGFDHEAARRFGALMRMLGLHHQALFRRLYTEAFEDGARRFVEVLSALLPHLPREAVVCRLYATAITVTATDDPLSYQNMAALNVGGQPIDRDRWIAELLPFFVAGFRAAAAAPRAGAIARAS